MNQSVSVTLWAPSFLRKERIETLASEMRPMSLNGLETLISKSDVFLAKPQSFFAQASYLYHQPDTLPKAVTILAGLKQQETGFWLCVDPVQMVPDRDSLLLIPAHALSISETESQALMDSFNNHFAQDKVQLVYGDVSHWFMKITQPVDIHTTDLNDVSFQHVNDYYPAGNASSYWHQLMNEVQMLFYTHPVNEARRLKGMPEINSVWVWGEGQLMQEKLYPRPDAMIWSSHAYLKGMAKLTDSKSSETPENYQAWSSEKHSCSHHLICLDHLDLFNNELSEQEWLQALESFEKDWMFGLVQAVKQGEIDSLFVEFGAKKRFHLTPKHFKRFWRFKKKLLKL